MKICNLNYNFQFQLLVCVKHDLCIAFKFFKKHLQRLHEVKEERLRATLIEVAQLQVRDSRQINASIDNTFILYFSIDIEYRCEYIVCNERKNVLNKNRRTMKKHLTKKHNIEKKEEKTSLTINDFRTICVQSFCARNHYRLFVVRVKRNRNDENASISSIFSIENSISHAIAFSHAINEVFDSMQVKLKQKYERNQRD